jgi:hypothetical protein
MQHDRIDNKERRRRNDGMMKLRPVLNGLPVSLVAAFFVNTAGQ